MLGFGETPRHESPRAGTVMLVSALVCVPQARAGERSEVGIPTSLTYLWRASHTGLSA
jgi:hypothetical protein